MEPEFNNNISDYTKIELAVLDDIKLMHSFSGNAKVELTSSGKWHNIPFQYGNATIQITPTISNTDTHYDVDIFINVPKHHINDELETAIIITLISGGILRYTTNNEETYIVGSDTSPVRLLSENITPEKTLGFSNVTLQMTGKQMHPQLLLIE